MQMNMLVVPDSLQRWKMCLVYTSFEKHKAKFVQRIGYSSLFSSYEHTLAQLTRCESDLARDSFLKGIVVLFECNFIEIALYSDSLYGWKEKQLCRFSERYN